MSEQQRIDAYMDTVKRLEKDIAPIDNGAAAASIAVSLKRIADCLAYIIEAAEKEGQ